MIDRPAAPSPAMLDDDAIDIGELFDVLLRHKWVIILTTLLGLLIGYWLYLKAVPKYAATTVLQVEYQSAGYGNAFLSFLSEEGGGPVMMEKVSLAAEMTVMKSRSVLLPVVRELKLDLVARPVYFPVIGEVVARHFHSGTEPAPALFGSQRYSWGGDRIQLGALDLPPTWFGVPFVLVTEEGGRFRLRYEQEEILTGQVGERARGQLGGDSIEVFISYLDARPGTEFTLMRRSERSVVDQLRQQISINENPRGSSVLEVRAEDISGVRAAEIANLVVEIYLRRSIEQKSEEADKTLAYMEEQLPQLRARVEDAEARYNNYRLDQGSIDIQHETENILNSIVEIDSKLFTLQQEREELRQQYKPAHPKIQSIDRLTATLNERVGELETAMMSLPVTQQEVLKLAREVEVSSQLFSQLLNSIQELRIAKAGTVGDIQVIDTALPALRPFTPSRTKTVGIAVVLGLFGGVGLAFLLAKLHQGIENPEVIERELGLPVYGSIPHSEIQKRHAKAMKKQGKHWDGFLLAREQPEDVVIESFRSLRTSLHFLMMEASNRAILITGPRAGVGKSFVSLNLAAVLAQGGKQVLLIDGDLRRGHLNRYLQYPKTPGLSDYLLATQTREAIIRSTKIPGLDFIACGERPSNPSELLLTDRFKTLIASFEDDYDFVFIDAPPALVVADAGVIGASTGTTLLVVREGMHHIAEIDLTVKRLQQGGVSPRGFVMNDVQPRQGYGYGYRYSYRYGYKPYGQYSSYTRRAKDED